MSRTDSDQPPLYELKATTAGTGALDPRTALLMWGTGSIIVGLLISFLLVQGNLRMVVLVLLSVLSVACLSPRRGVYILTIFLPFMYYIRRLVLNFQEYDARDMILLFPAVTALLMFVGVIIFYGPLVYRYVSNSALLKACALLLGVFAMQVFNPLQGTPVVGMAGAMYFVVPMLWVVFGLLMTRDDIRKVFKIIIVIGIITALYGLYQHFWGLTAVEIYELKAKRFLKFLGDNKVRIMSTFASLGDFSLYLFMAGFLTFAQFWRSKRNLFLLGLFVLNMYTMLWMAVRSSFLMVAFSITILFTIYGRSANRVFVRGLVAMTAIIAIYAALYTYDPKRMYDQQFSTNPYVVHTLSGITHPTQENSFRGRLESWSSVLVTTFTQYPVGRGLGSTTPAASKFSEIESINVDSYFFELFYGSGLLAPPIFVFIVYRVLKDMLGLCLAEPDEYTHKMCLGLMAGFLLGSVFALAMRDTITGPVAWLLIGWTARQQVDRKLGIPPTAAEAVERA